MCQHDLHMCDCLYYITRVKIADFTQNIVGSLSSPFLNSQRRSITRRAKFSRLIKLVIQLKLARYVNYRHAHHIIVMFVYANATAPISNTIIE